LQVGAFRRDTHSSLVFTSLDFTHFIDHQNPLCVLYVNCELTNDRAELQQAAVNAIDPEAFLAWRRISFLNHCRTLIPNSETDDLRTVRKDARRKRRMVELN
jgi:hypothetical protein